MIRSALQVSCHLTQLCSFRLFLLSTNPNMLEPSVSQAFVVIPPGMQSSLFPTNTTPVVFLEQYLYKSDVDKRKTSPPHHRCLHFPEDCITGPLAIQPKAFAILFWHLCSRQLNIRFLQFQGPRFLISTLRYFSIPKQQGM